MNASRISHSYQDREFVVVAIDTTKQQSVGWVDTAAAVLRKLHDRAVEAGFGWDGAPYSIVLSLGIGGTLEAELHANIVEEQAA